MLSVTLWRDLLSIAVGDGRLQSELDKMKILLLQTADSRNEKLRLLFALCIFFMLAAMCGNFLLVKIS